MENDHLRELVEQKIAAGDTAPEWIMALVAMRTLSVLQSIDQRLGAINDEALAPDHKGHTISGAIVGLVEMFERALERAYPNKWSR